MALLKVVVLRETRLTRLETDRVHCRALSDSLRASCQNISADSHCDERLISSSFSLMVKRRTVWIHHLSSPSLQHLYLAQLKPPRLPLHLHFTLDIVIFVGSLLGKLRIRGMSALGLSHQWPQQQDS